MIKFGYRLSINVLYVTMFRKSEAYKMKNWFLIIHYGGDIISELLFIISGIFTLDDVNLLEHLTRLKFKLSFFFLLLNS